MIAEAKSSSREFNKQSAIGRFLAGGDQIYRLTHFPAEGGFFERERTYMAPSFHKRALFQYADTMAEIDERYIENLKDGEERSIHEDMKAVTLEAVGKTLFSINNPSDLEVLLAAFEIVLKDIGGRVGNPLRIPPIIPTPHNLKLRWAVNTTVKILGRVIDEHKVEKEELSDFIDMLKVAKGGPGFLNDPEWQYTLAGFLIAGYETTGVGLSWAWYLLAKHPEIIERIREETDEVVGDRKVRGSDYPKLKYTERVFKEVLRLYPPIPVIPRNAGVEYRLGNYKVPKGTLVLVCPWVTQRDSRYFKDPSKFNPDRWENNISSPYAYVPFSAGPRHCIGYGYASMEGTLALAVVLREFNFELIEGREPIPKFSGVSCQPSNGLPMIVRRRK